MFCQGCLEELVGRALELLQRCIDIYEEDVGPEHDYVRKALIQMSASLTAVGEVQRAADVNASPW